jgi:hypothetical protein
MQPNNPFDSKLETSKRMPSHFREAAIELTDTLDVCWAAAQAVFEGKAKPEHALALLPQFMVRADEKHRQLLARFGRDADGESLPPPAGQ